MLLRGVSSVLWVSGSIGVYIVYPGQPCNMRGFSVVSVVAVLFGTNRVMR